MPNEWNIRDAWIKDASGTKVVDFQQSNLHVVNYSVPVHRRMSFQELRPHLFTIPEHPDWIPYRTSYYRETWGFCLSHNQLQRMCDGDYEVCIDSSLKPGHLTYGELLVPGEREDEFLISAHICHPSLCNDNLSGVSISAHLARHMLDEKRRRRSYRFLFIPGTIGAITWLAQNAERLERVRGGLTLVCLGTPVISLTNEALTETPKSTVLPPTSWLDRESHRTSSISFPTATTNANSTLPGFVCRSVR